MSSTVSAMLFGVVAGIAVGFAANANTPQAVHLTRSLSNGLSQRRETTYDSGVSEMERSVRESLRPTR